MPKQARTLSSERVLSEFDALLARSYVPVGSWKAGGDFSRLLEMNHGRGSVAIDFRPRQGTVGTGGGSSADSVRPEEMSSAKVAVGVGLAIGFMEVWEKADADRLARNAPDETPEEREIDDATSDLLRIILAVATATEREIGDRCRGLGIKSASRKRVKIHAYSKR